jgi:hypothetical protein
LVVRDEDLKNKDHTKIKSAREKKIQVIGEKDLVKFIEFKKREFSKAATRVSVPSKESASSTQVSFSSLLLLCLTSLSLYGSLFIIIFYLTHK